MCSGGCHCCQSCSLADPVIIPSQEARHRIIHHPGRRDWRAIRFGLVPSSLLRDAVGKKNAMSKKENTHAHTQHFRECHLQFCESRSWVWHVYKHARPLQIPSKLNTYWWWCEKIHTEIAFTNSPLLLSVASFCGLALFGTTAPMGKLNSE